MRTLTTMATTIWTVGHGARPIATFLQILDGEVELVVDVRSVPGSRRHPQFGRPELASSLLTIDKAYTWEQDLGGFRRPVPDSEHTAIRNASFRGYADHMGTDAFRGALERLIETSHDTQTAVMCAESVWWRCHRRMIADALVIRDIDVRHLMDGGRWDPHQLHPSARIDGDRLVYDVDQGRTAAR